MSPQRTIGFSTTPAVLLLVAWMAGCHRSTEKAAPTASVVATSASPAAPVVTASAGKVSAPSAVGEPGWHASVVATLPPAARALRTKAVATCPAGMVLVPRAKLTIGATPNPIQNLDEIQEDRQGMADLPNESPSHAESVESFCIDAIPVTIAEYDACSRAGACKAAHARSTSELDACSDRADTTPFQAVDCVDHSQAAAYCKALDQRLPEETEWELAARSTDGRVYPWGTPKVPTGALIPFTAPEVCVVTEAKHGCVVGEARKGASPYGVLDMAGAHQEWTATPFCSYREPGCKSSAFTLRSGISPFFARTYARRAGAPEQATGYLGFRCATGPRS